MSINMEEVQKKILEIVHYLDEFCRENDITYYLMGGSALGAIRHGGFIPWDDDLDVFMTFENYMKFIKICESHLDRERFYLQKENTDEWPMFFSKLRMNNTTYIEKDTKDRKMHQGFFIDVMCLNNTASNLFIRYFQFLAARILTAQTLAIRGYITKNKIKKISIETARLFVGGRIKKILLSFVRRYNNKNTKYVGHFFGKANFKNTSFPRYYLGKPKHVDFHNKKLPVPEYVEDYLTVRFGRDFMKIPNMKIRDKYPTHAIYVDLEKGTN